MAVFQYKAVNQQGQTVKGLVEATTVEGVIELLSEKNLVILALEESKHGFMSGVKIPLIGRVRRKSVVIFSRQLAVMIAATVPVVQALRILVAQTNEKTLKDIVQEIANDVDGGMKTSSALAKHPRVFNNFFVAMVKSGETSGRLDKVLNYLADQMEKDYDLISRIKGAMVYPIFILLAMTGVSVVMLVFVIPRLTSLLEESGAKLPFVTRILINTSDFLVNFWWLIIIVIAGGLMALRFFLRTDYGRNRWDKAKLYVPIFGQLFQKIILTRIARSLSTLIKGGVPISTGLKITSEVANNRYYGDLLEQTVKEVEDGNSITGVFSQSKLVPTMVPQMMSVGERTGRMDEILDRLADFYSREVDNLIGALTSLIEPLIMIILGVGVGVMVAAVILPIFQVANSLA